MNIFPIFPAIQLNMASITVPISSASNEPILDNGQGVIDPDVYFEINEPPADLPEFESKLNAFVDYHKEAGSKVVFITVSTKFMN